MTNLEYANGLRLAADFYEAHPEIPVPGDKLDNFSTNGKDMARLVVKALGYCDKKYYDNGLLDITAKRGAITLRFVFLRDDVCEKVVVGTKTIPAHVIPATAEVEVPEQVIEETEWRCGSLLSPSEDAELEVA